MAGKKRLEGKNGEIALDMLYKITNLLEQNGIRYWLEGGTLLGIIRENRLLPWDNDIDISVTEDDYGKILNLIDNMKRLGYMVWDKEFTQDNPPFRRGMKRIIKMRNRKFYFIRGDVALDIFIKFEMEDRYFWQVGEKKKSVPAYFYRELIYHKFNGKEYLIPKKYEEYLQFRYGKDWRTPIKEWNTFKDDNALESK